MAAPPAERDNRATAPSIAHVIAWLVIMLFILTQGEAVCYFHGLFAGEPSPNPQEIGAYRWMLSDRIRCKLATRPDWYTPWFSLLPVMHTAD